MSCVPLWDDGDRAPFLCKTRVLAQKLERVSVFKFPISTDSEWKIRKRMWIRRWTRKCTPKSVSPLDRRRRRQLRVLTHLHPTPAWKSTKLFEILHT